MKLERIAIIDCEWAPSAFAPQEIGTVDLIEWAAILLDFDPYKGWVETGRVQGLVYYPGPLPKRIQKLTGICPTELLKAKSFDQWAETIELFTRHRTLVGHHIEQDYQVLKEHFQRIGQSFKRETFCTLKEARKQWPGLASYELNKLAELFDFSFAQHHRAEHDAEMTWKLLEKCQRPSLKIESVSDLNKEEDFSQFPWLSHHSRNKFHSLPNKPGILSFYSHKKLLSIVDCLDLKKEARDHLKATLACQNPLTDIKFSAHPHLLINRLTTIDLREKFKPQLSPKTDLPYAIVCYKNPQGLLTLKVVSYKKASHHRYLDIAADKREAQILQKKLQTLFQDIPHFHYIDPVELKELTLKVNRQRQQQIDLWKQRYNGNYTLQNKTLEYRSKGVFLIKEQTTNRPQAKELKATAEMIIEFKNLRMNFERLSQKLLTSHSQHCDHSL